MVALPVHHEICHICELTMKDGRRNNRNMASTTDKWSKEEMQAVIRFLYAKGNPSTAIHKELAL